MALQLLQHLTSPHLTSPHLTSPHLTSPHLTSLHFTSLHFTSLHFTSLHFTSLHFTSLHFTSLHFTSLHFTSLHSTSLDFTWLTWLHLPSHLETSNTLSVLMFVAELLNGMQRDEEKTQSLQHMPADNALYLGKSSTHYSNLSFPYFLYLPSALPLSQTKCFYSTSISSILFFFPFEAPSTSTNAPSCLLTPIIIFNPPPAALLHVRLNKNCYAAELTLVPMLWKGC